ncbi:MAG: cysteine desulfurase NifS [Chloroflexi bacterium]|nr:cysteine desulfurase NifS [Chloroflexota bacterium]|tara:strand:- start:1285 stop:2454 length:1170 start_codon:yes stop_codon:yes gene_type:complete
MTFEIDQVYCDNAATTPVTPEVLEEMLPFFTESFGNPSSLYMLSQDSRSAIEFSRDKVAKVINSNPSEITFTSGGTESNNLAMKGVCLPEITDDQNEIIISTIEHHAIIHPAEQLKSIGYEVKYCPVDDDGIIKIDDFLNMVTNKTKFVSIMLANNEIGSVQNIKALVEIVREKEKDFNKKIYFHTDAVQAVGKISIDVKNLGVDLLSISGHKFNAPKGVGALYINEYVTVEPLLDGGGQERQNRSGTENVPSIVGIGKAIEIAESNRENFYNHTKDLSDRFIDSISNKIPDFVLHSAENGLSNIVNFSIPNIQGEPILIGLDFKGIMASSGSACSTASIEPSHVLLAKGVDEKLALGSVRLSFSNSNTFEEIDYIVESIYEVCKDLKS